MAWIDPHYAKNLPPPVDINKKFMTELKGNLEESKARSTLGQFLYYNLQFTVRILMGLVMRPFQAALMRTWFIKNFNLVCAGRGFGKSFLIGIYSVLYAIFNPGVKILIVSSNFRSSRRILESIESISKKTGGALMRQVFDGNMSRRNDVFRWVTKHGAEIICLPLADGEGLRGQRANVLIVDEALLVSRSIIENVLMPFISAKGMDESTQILKIKQKEDRLIKEGKMKESEREIFRSKNKMILLSSASFEGEYFHEKYLEYLNKIQGIHGKGSGEETEMTHSVYQLSYEVMMKLAPDIMDKSVIEEVESGTLPQSVIDREYKARFIQDSGGLFRMSRMKACTIKDGETPTIEIVGEHGAEYVLAIDPNVSGSELADHFAMSLLKIVTKKDGKKIGMLVHSYAAAAVELKDHIEYFLYLLDCFNIVYIAVDSTQGDNMDFINVCNESEIFKNRKIELKAIDAEFGKEDQSTISEQIKASYNLKTRVIVQKQNFHSSFQNAAVDHLQACIDFGNIIFAGKAVAAEGVTGAMAEQDIKKIDEKHKLFKEALDGNPKFAFIERQDYLIDLTKSECALIQTSVSSLGTRSFDIPQAYKRSKNINRPRKDNFSSLMLANWALKLFLASREIPDETPQENVVFMRLG